jgi:hypothetical protein
MATAQEPVIKRRGNPNFGQKKTEEQVVQEIEQSEFDKQYIFQLIKTHEKSKPRDEDGQVLGSAYQPFYAVINQGVAWDPEYLSPSELKKPKHLQKAGGRRRWRYVATQPSIWVDEQVDPEPTKEELADEKNYLELRQGIIRVFGHETTKLQALKINDAFKDCLRPLKVVEKEYVLLDQDKIDKEVLQLLDDSFEAEKFAREATLEEMYAVSYFFGIDMSKSDDAIRKAFIGIARSKPAVFKREFVNPKNKYKYLMLEAFADNLISTTLVPGKVCFVETGAPLFDINTPDAAEEIASLIVANSSKAVNLYNQLKKSYENAE